MEYDPKIGGICGFMGVKEERVYDRFGVRTDDFQSEIIDPVSQLFSYMFNI